MVQISVAAGFHLCSADMLFFLAVDGIMRIMTRKIYIFSLILLLTGVFYLSLTSGALAAGADINNDGIVNVQDLGIMLSNWGATGSNIADISGDNTINVQDLGIMLSNWGASIPVPPPPPPPPPPGGSNLLLNFDDPNNLGLNCAGGTLGGPSCPNWFTGGYRKHSYLPNGGTSGSGAINMHWQTGMSIGFSPIWVDPIPLARHFKISYRVRQNATMTQAGSNVKLHRIRAGTASGPTTNIGTLLSGNGRMSWYWEHWTSNDPVSPIQLGINTPTDNQWHLYEIELDYRDVNRMVFTFWLDGRFIKTTTMATRVGDMMAGATTLVFSPFAEMYSCGQPPACSSSLNTGDYAVDDFGFMILP